MYNKQRAVKSYSITSPYMQLLQSKKKVYGLKYHSNFNGQSSNSKQNNHNNSTNLTSSKARPASSSAHHNKSNIKSNSSQKVKSTKSHNTKKKRIYTQQGQSYNNQMNSDPKLHQSLFVNLMQKQSNLNSKSLYYNNGNTNLQYLQAKQKQFNQQNYLNNYDFLKKFSEFNTNIKQKQNKSYTNNNINEQISNLNSNNNNMNNMINYSGSKSQKSNKSKGKQKNKSKSKQSKQQYYHNNNNINNNINNQPLKNNYTRSINFQSIGKSVQNLNLIEVQDLICLIDNCVSQANQYISFLASKIQSLKNQVMKCKTQQFQLERIIKQKNQQLQQKDHIIYKLKKQIESIKSSNSLNNSINNNNSNKNNLFNQNQDFKSKQMKKILQVLNEMNQQNNFLQSKIKNLQYELQTTKKSSYNQKNNQKLSQQQDQQPNNYLNNPNVNIDDELRNKYYINSSKEKRKSSFNQNKQIYNQIHSKIDILNISIDNNKKISTNNNYSISSADNQNKSQSKKYKFIKPKNK